MHGFARRPVSTWIPDPGEVPESRWIPDPGQVPESRWIPDPGEVPPTGKSQHINMDLK
ncbi:MAG: hypothetical protein R6U78_09765 [Bacteroidales bacterium]